MTVLSQFERLECPGVWRADAAAQRRNVYVTLGKATLVIMSESGEALSHWSLPALERIDDGQIPAEYRPGPDSGERLELDDDTMIGAIETVRRAILRRAPHHGRLRGVMGWGALAVLAGFALFWVPDRIRAYTAAAVPAPVQDDIGTRLLRELVRVTGPACTYGPSLAAADRLADRLFGAGARRIAVLSGGPVRTMALPGGTLLIHRDLIETARSVEVPAGYLLAEARRSAETPPLRALLDASSVWTSIRLLTSGDIAQPVLARHAEAMPLSEPVAITGLGAAFAASAVAPAPYLFDLTARGLPVPQMDNAASDPRTVLSDADWVRLQSICEA